MARSGEIAAGFAFIGECDAVSLLEALGFVISCPIIRRIASEVIEEGSPPETMCVVASPKDPKCFVNFEGGQCDFTYATDDTGTLWICIGEMIDLSPFGFTDCTGLVVLQ